MGGQGKREKRGLEEKNLICFAGVIELEIKFLGVNGLEGFYVKAVKTSAIIEINQKVIFIFAFCRANTQIYFQINLHN